MQVLIRTTDGRTLGDFIFPEVPAVGDVVVVPGGDRFEVVRRVFGASEQRGATIWPVVVVRDAE